tara:strand:- start:295 stop:501 length:207 start_codon:yes stop_codon:yes gene_type:complete
MDNRNRIAEWNEKNPWFLQAQTDDFMTFCAYQFHRGALKAGIEPGSVKYFEHIDASMRLTFPEYEWPD